MPDTTTMLPAKIAALIEQRQLVEADQPNPEPRPGQPRHPHQRHPPVDRWPAGRGCYLDDGYDLITEIADLLGWRPVAEYGDWPMVVEWLRRITTDQARPVLPPHLPGRVGVPGRVRDQRCRWSVTPGRGTTDDLVPAPMDPPTGP